MPETAPPRRETPSQRRTDKVVPPPSPSAPAPSRGWITWLLLLSMAGGAAYYRHFWWPVAVSWIAPARSEAPVKPAAKSVAIRAVKARQGDLELYLNGLGTVTAFNTVTIRSRVEGELVRVAFTEGQMVKNGDLLAEIDPRPFQVQLEQAEGQLAKDEAARAVAQLSLDRYNALAATRAITPQQIDEQVALVKQSEGAIQTDRSAIDDAKLQLTYCRITSPITGRIGLRLVDPGNIVRADDLTGLAVVTQLQPIALIFTIPQDEISRVQRKLREGQGLTVEAFNRDFSDKLATGELLAIDNQVDSTTGTVRLKAVFANEDNMLFPNQFVNARLLVDMKRNAVIVPTAAVQRGPDSMFVYVVKADETVEMRNVTTGPAEGDEICIDQGLAAGEVVATDGIDKLRPGAKVVLRDDGRPEMSTEKKLADSGVQGGR
ncbi:MAG TPA: MdtA/MuxA family multidrug efflux RND transporter periplasmic adaptor subunit [Pirellulales bacterium]|nr:MdtA/MuxA family multidrug efflux RND transporter periplasmic adaptor subunit [Pirellulales bacterium]